MPIKEIKYTNDAFASLFSLVNFIEDTNTVNAGIRWLVKYENFVFTRLLKTTNFTLCKNKTFAKLHLYCLLFNDWVIAYSIHNEYFLIEVFLHKSRIVD
jgi:hypothetical protein